MSVDPICLQPRFLSEDAVKALLIRHMERADVEAREDSCGKRKQLYYYYYYY